MNSFIISKFSLGPSKFLFILREVVSILLSASEKWNDFGKVIAISIYAVGVLVVVLEASLNFVHISVVELGANEALEVFKRDVSVFGEYNDEFIIVKDSDKPFAVIFE